ncbi:PH domain-containing protein [Nocardia brasiliensis]|uniref:PH domain-containing protein n=1 Tax=Nocardia brasiliensis TaxID=37326 RepID=A0A6G9XYM5_NOCBR|nr:PH domain-containing protein [Nocardia brasiliensis]QIS06024.1 PH domain-containing protein [Nocardia brasiliensis]
MTEIAQAPTPETDQPWSRLDKRMLLVHPVTEVVKFIPVLIGSVILGTSSGNHIWSVIPLVAIVGFALTRWFTTAYRVGPTHVELRTGLIQRKKLSVPRSRIRSVDIEADLLHRVLGLAVLAIGTGQQADSGEKFELDALDARLVPELRAALLAHTAQATPTDATHDEGGQQLPSDAAATAPPDAREIAHWQPQWVRYAPLSLTGFAIIAPIVGVAFQYGVGQLLFRSDTVRRFENGGALVLAVGVFALVVLVVAVVSLAACARYLTTYFGLRVLDDGRTLHLRHGLFTTRQITLDLARFRGATVNEPLLLRSAGAAELEAIMVGENPRQKILPQAPRAAIEHTLGHLLARNNFADKAIGTPETGAADPGNAPLRPHGPIARRRRYTRALAPVAVLALGMAVAASAGVRISPWWWLVPVSLALLAIPLARDRYRGLGHTVLPQTASSPTWLITRSGSLDRDRDCLEAPGVIGWTVRQSFFQRRAGVATVVAATAAGKKRYHVIDIPIEQAWSLIEAVTPGRLG